MKTSAHLTYKALLSLNTDEYDQRILEFKRIQCTDPNKLISHFDELLRAYNRTMVSLPAPAYALTIEPELASAALLSVLLPKRPPKVLNCMSTQAAHNCVFGIRIKITNLISTLATSLSTTSQSSNKPNLAPVPRRKNCG